MKLVFNVHLTIKRRAPTSVAQANSCSRQVKIWGKDLAGQFTLSCVEEVWDIAVSGDICFTVRDKDITCTEIKFREYISTPGRAKGNFLIFCLYWLPRAKQPDQLEIKPRSDMDRVWDISNYPHPNSFVILCQMKVI